MTDLHRFPDMFLIPMPQPVVVALAPGVHVPEGRQGHRELRATLHLGKEVCWQLLFRPKHSIIKSKISVRFIKSLNFFKSGKFL